MEALSDRRTHTESFPIIEGCYTWSSGDITDSTMTFASTCRINRYYDPSTDSFISVDPDVQQTDQPYVFVNGDPLNKEDPLGLSGNLCDIYSSSKAQQKCMNTINPSRLAPSVPSVKCGANFDATGVCKGHPQDNFDAGPSIYTHWNFSAGACSVVCISAAFQNGTLQISAGVGTAVAFPGVATGYNSKQLSTGFKQSDQIFASSPAGQGNYDADEHSWAAGAGPSAISGWGGGYVHIWSYGWHL